MPSILNVIRQTAAGRAIIDDWLGTGGQLVPREQAETRAAVCLTCPHNKAPRWWEHAKGSIAQAIRDMLSIKNECALELPQEESLNMCEKCGCCIRLKCWAPKEHVRKVLDLVTLSELPHFCWMRRELIDS
jgi:hypothetical protein